MLAVCQILSKWNTAVISVSFFFFELVNSTSVQWKASHSSSFRLKVWLKIISCKQLLNALPGKDLLCCVVQNICDLLLKVSSSWLRQKSISLHCGHWKPWVVGDLSSPRLLSSFVYVFLLRTCTRTDVHKAFCVCLSNLFSCKMLRLLRLQLVPLLPHFSLLFAEVEALALHPGWAFIILSYCKAICMQTKFRKSNLLQEWHINLGGRGLWQCTAGAKLLDPGIFFSQAQLNCMIALLIHQH